jgi:hypothetical protein
MTAALLLSLLITVSSVSLSGAPIQFHMRSMKTLGPVVMHDSRAFRPAGALEVVFLLATPTTSTSKNKNKNKIFTSYKASTSPQQQRKAKVKIKKYYLIVF